MIRDNQDRLSRFYARKPRNPKYWNAIRISEPTVFDVDDFEAADNARTIRQIINGQCAYSGTQIEPTPDPFDKGKYARRPDDERIIARLRETWQRLKAE